MKIATLIKLKDNLIVLERNFYFYCYYYCYFKKVL